MKRTFVFAFPFLVVAQAAFSNSPQDALDVKTPARVIAPAIEPVDGPQVESAIVQARTPRELGATALTEPRERLVFDTTPEGDVWIRGRTYKAHFGRDAAQYVPFLGSRAPRNFPIDLRVDSVTIGGEPVAFEAAAPAVREGNSIVFERGAFRERFLLASDTVEQTFEFDALPRRGEIVIRLAFASDLAPAADAEGFTFSNELGHVRYGRASVYHDALDRTAVASRLDGDRIEITAPASLVQEAVGRFVVDPVLTTNPVESGAADEFGADTAYDETHSSFLTVTEEVFSAGDHDIHAVRHSMGGFISAETYVDSSFEDWRTPAVMNHQVDDQFLVVAARGSAPSRKIYGRTVQATLSLNMSEKLQISSDAQTGDNYAPDVGCDFSYQLPAYYFVVWEREFLPGADYDIFGRLVRTDAVLLQTVVVDNSAGTIHRNPSVSNTNGEAGAVTQKWNVVWEEQVSPTNRNILGARVRYDGTLTDPTFAVASSVLDERNPVATATIGGTTAVRPWMVAYQVDGGADGWDVRCRSLDGTSIVATLDLSDQFGTPTLDQITPSVDVVYGQFIIAYEERPQGFATTSDIKVSTLFTINGSLGVNEGNLSASPGLELDSRPRIAARGHTSGTYSEALVVFDRDMGGPNDVLSTGYDVPWGGPVTEFCAGDGTATACPCGNNGGAGRGCANSVNPEGARLQGVGDARILYDDFVLSASGLPATAPVLFFQGTVPSGAGSGVVFGDGLRCVSGSVIRLATKTAAGGQASYPVIGEMDISIRGAIPEIGGLRYYQAWYRNIASFCTPSGFNLTNGLRVQWIP